MTDTTSHTLIETTAALEEMVAENKDITWMGFDTEFVGEKRFFTLLCLIQISTKNGFYLIDSLKIKDLSPFLQLITNPNILKITHAGENDYRLLNRQFGIIPKNIFDTQVIAGFVGYNYPISFRKLVDRELNLQVSKGYTVTDWQKRPLKAKQIKYALNDVIPLYQLYTQLTHALEKLNRTHWAEEEMKIYETEAYYEDDIHREALDMRLMQQSKLREQVFLLRLMEWRREEARKKNYSKEMIMPNKMIAIIVRNMNSGRNALRDNRIVNNKMLDRYWDTFNSLFQAPPTDEERQILKRIPKIVEEDSKQELTSELLYLLIKKRCGDMDVSTSMVVSKNELKRIRQNPNGVKNRLAGGWREELLGKELIEWVRNPSNLEMKMEDGKCIISM